MGETVGNLKNAKLFVDLANAALDASAKFKVKENQEEFRNFALYLMYRAEGQTEYKPPDSQDQ